MSHVDKKTDPRKTVLANGLTLLTETMPERQSISVGAWLRSGARDEPRSLMGVSHFLEHMLFKGTGKRSALEIAKSLESRGGHLDAFTTREYVCYYARCLEEHGDLAVDVLADLVGHSVLADEEIEREKSVVREEIQSYEDNPEEKVHDVFAEVLWGSNPLGWPILGTLESLDALTPTDIRSFYHDRYRANSMVLSITGSFDPPRMIDQVASLFDLPGGDPTTLSVVESKGNPESQPVAVSYVPREVAQVNMVLGRLGIPQCDPRRYPLAVLNAIVGGGMSSRLFQSVRESAGLAYSVYSSTDFYRDTGLITIAMGVRPERVAEALEKVAVELDKFIRHGPTAEELDSGRSQIKGNLILSQESVTNHMTHMAMDEIYYGRYIPVNEHVREVAAVDRDQVMDLAREFLRPETFSLVALGPEEAENDLRASWPPDTELSR